MSTAVLAMTAYHSTVVTKSPDPATQDADAKAHHVKGWSGKTVKYQNPHPSFSPLNFKDMAVTVWFVHIIALLPLPKTPPPPGPLGNGVIAGVWPKSPLN